VTAKEKLRARVEALSERDAERLLATVERELDPVVVAFANAPKDDEPVSAEEEAAVARSRAEYARGEAVTLEEIRDELA
jgi:hypothetical protein